jgi:hypothetical protein
LLEQLLDNPLAVEDLTTIDRSTTCCGGPKPSSTRNIPDCSCPTGPPPGAGLDRVMQDFGGATFVKTLTAKSGRSSARVVEVDCRHTSHGAKPAAYPNENRASQPRPVGPHCGDTAHDDERSPRNNLRGGVSPLAAAEAAGKLARWAVREATFSCRTFRLGPL